MGKAIGARLRQMRAARNLSIRDWAKYLEVGEKRYDKWERGLAVIPIDEVLRLKRRFGITSDWLYFADESAMAAPVKELLSKAA